MLQAKPKGCQAWSCGPEILAAARNKTYACRRTPKGAWLRATTSIGLRGATMVPGGHHHAKSRVDVLELVGRLPDVLAYPPVELGNSTLSLDRSAWGILASLRSNAADITGGGSAGPHGGGPSASRGAQRMSPAR